MGHFESKHLENKAVLEIAAIMAANARTAPKANGVDDIDIALLDGEELEALARCMDEIAEQKPSPYPSVAFQINGNDLRKANAVLLMGVKGSRHDTEKPLDCGSCGFRTCSNFKKAGRRQGGDFVGPTCIMKALDLGIAIGSAVKMAGECHIDNRIMYTIGAAAQKLHLLDSDIIMGIPLSVTGKNPYYDRRPGLTFRNT